MAELLEVAIRRAWERPPEERNELALHLLHQLEQGPSDVQLTDAQVEEVRAVQARLAAGEEDFVSEEEMDAFWRRCGLDRTSPSSS